MKGVLRGDVVLAFGLFVLLLLAMPSSLEAAVPKLSAAGMNITCADYASFLLSPAVQANQTVLITYNVTILSIEEITPSAEVVSKYTKLAGNWTDIKITTEYSNSNITFVLPTGVIVDDHYSNTTLSVNIFLFETNAIETYGHLDYLSFKTGDVGIEVRVDNWPFHDESNRVEVVLRTTVFRGPSRISNTDLIWEQSIGTGGHIDELTIINDHSIKFQYPMVALSDDVNIYTGVGINDIEYALEMSLNFYHFNKFVSYIFIVNNVKSEYEEAATIVLIVVVILIVLGFGCYMAYNWYKNKQEGGATIFSA